LLHWPFMGGLYINEGQERAKKKFLTPTAAFVIDVSVIVQV